MNDLNNKPPNGNDAFQNPIVFSYLIDNSKVKKYINEPPSKDISKSADAPTDTNNFGKLPYIIGIFFMVIIVLAIIEYYIKKACGSETTETFPELATIVDLEEIDTGEIKLIFSLKRYVDIFEDFFYTEVQGEELQRIISESENKCCKICLEDFELSSTVRALKCSHIYHKNCIDECILALSFNCPYCRYSLV